MDPLGLLYSFLAQIGASIGWLLGLVGGQKTNCPAPLGQEYLRPAGNIGCAIETGFRGFVGSFGLDPGSGVSLLVVVALLFVVGLFLLYLLWRVFKKWVVIGVLALLALFFIRAAIGG